MVLILSRPKKLDHVDTIHYEIDMLRFAASKLALETLTERDAWVYLEAFLLHYRNLIEFFGKDNASSTDLHVTNIWQIEGLPVPTNVNQIHQNGQALWAKYEPSDAQGGGRISQYLQHCTIKRIDAKDWEVSAMMNDIEPLLTQIEPHLGPHKGLLAHVSTVTTLGPISASTTVATMTTAAMLKPPNSGSSIT
jgi:hypothetical protein